MATKVFVHGSGHKADSWKPTISHMTDGKDIVCPNLSSILDGKKASYEICMLHLQHTAAE